MLRRIYKEYQRFINDPAAGCAVLHHEDFDYYCWHLELQGPKGTPYEGGTFVLEVCFSTDYPFKAPKVRFLTKTFHLSIDSDGQICMHMLGDGWSPACTVNHICNAILLMMSEPDEMDFKNKEAYELFMQNKPAYEQKVREWTLAYAVKPT